MSGATTDVNSLLGNGEDYSIDSFVTEEQDSVQAPIVSRKSNTLMAAKVAAISGEDAQSTFQQVHAELMTGAASESVGKVIERVQSRDKGRTQEALTNVIADPTISFERKQDLVNKVVNQGQPAFSLNTTILNEGLIASSKTDVGLEMEQVRINLSDIVNEINDAQRAQQQLLNEAVTFRDVGGTGKALVEIANMFAPFLEQAHYAELTSDSSDSGIISNFAFLGANKAELRDSIRKMPPALRLEAAAKLAEHINTTETYAAIDSNDYARIDALRVALEDGYYEDSDEMIDNIVSVMDVAFGLGTIGKMLGFGKIAGRATHTVEAARRDAGRRAVRSDVQPASISQQYKEVNPEKAIALHEEVVKDLSGELAEATYGTSRVEAIASDLLPEVATNTGAVRNKVNMPEHDIHLDEVVTRSGAIELSPIEKASAKDQVIKDFRSNVAGTHRAAMSQVEHKPNGLRIKAVYGPSQGGFSTAQDSIDAVKISLRSYGITDDQITLLRREGDSYVPTSVSEVDAMATVSKLVEGKKGMVKVNEPKDFLVQVNHDYQINASDISTWEHASVRGNFFDKFSALIGNKQGSFTRHLLDAASLFDSRIALGANAAIDKAAGLEKRLIGWASDFSNKIVALPKDRQFAVMSQLKEANAEGIKFNSTKLAADGFDEAEIGMMKDWREAWDDMYWLDNQDMGKTLRARGYEMFIDEASDTQLFSRPLSRGKAGNTQRVYDQSTGEIRTVTKNEIDGVYATNGSLHTLYEPIHVGDEVADVVIARNQVGGSYSRKINANDQVLNYREGYYAVHYTDPKYIDKIFRDSHGNELYRKAVATSKNSVEAEVHAKRMRSQGDEVVVRADKHREQAGDPLREGMEVLSSRGRTAQRARGERLVESSAMDDLEMASVVDPVSAMVRSARTVSQRVATRDYLETTRARFVDQYKDVLPQDKFGRTLFPSDINQITKSGDTYSKELADARTTFEYIKYLEYGYINTLDDTMKAILNGAGNALGKRAVKAKGALATKVLTKAEEGALALADAPGITSLGKGLVFNAYLATNPIRQLIVQAHQATQLFALNPSYMLTKGSGDLVAMLAMKMGHDIPEIVLKTNGRTLEEFNGMYKAWQRSGLPAAVDKNAMLNGALSQLIEDGKLKTGKYGVASRVVDKARAIGFDIGEEVQLMSAWMAQRDKLISKGVDFGDELDDLTSAMTRNYTYNMGRAGDMPYNQNYLGMVFQFMQVPHKALLSWTTNRSISKVDKLKLLALNTTLYTLPPATMYSMFGEILPEDGELRDVVVQGLEPYMLNKALSYMSDEDVALDFSSLSPMDIHGSLQFATGLFTTDIGTKLAESPAGSLFFGNSPRITTAAKTWASFFNSTEDVSFADAAKATLSISSGFSNMFKAKYALEYGQSMSISGNITDPHVTRPEAWAKLAGFSTMDEAQRYWVGNRQYENSVAMKDDVTHYYKELKRTLATKGMSVKDKDFAIKAMNSAFKVFGNDNIKAKQMILSLIQRDIMAGDDSLFKGALDQANWPDAKSTRMMIENIPAEGWGKKDEMLRTLDYIDSLKNGK